MDPLQRQQRHEARTLLEAELSHSDIHDALRGAIRTAYPDSYVWLQDVYDAAVVAHIEGKEDTDGATIPSVLMRFAYTLSADGEVALGVGQEVIKRVIYEPVETPAMEAAEIAGDYVPLIERALRNDGTIGVKIIQPGMGSSGYYPAEVLERDGPSVFTSGLKMYADHATATEEAERPEGSIKNLVAEFVSDARWEAQGAAGPGLYADAKVFEHWQPFVEELAPHIGVSIRASGRAKPGEVDGRRVPVIEELVNARSVDFVTTPGAGGQILSLFEAARARAVETITPGGEAEVDEKQLQEAVAARDAAETKLTEAQAEIAQLRETVARYEQAEVIREAQVFIEGAVPATIEGLAPEVWKLSRDRLAEGLKTKVVVKEGKFDVDAMTEIVEAAVKAECEFLEGVLKTGRVTGMGPSDAIPTEESARAELVEAFERTGMTHEQAVIAAEGR